LLNKNGDFNVFIDYIDMKYKNIAEKSYFFIPMTL